MSAKKWTKREAEASLWISFEDFVVDGSLLSFTDHAGIDLRRSSDRRLTIYSNSR
jgi:hypothetical protein